MTTYTLAETATRVLKDLGLVGAEETPSASDHAWAEETVTSEVQMLDGLGLPIWNGSELAVPINYLTTLSRRIGLAVAPSFGMMSLADAQLAMREAERYLTVLAAPHTRPSLAKTNDAKPRFSRFNYTTG